MGWPLKRREFLKVTSRAGLTVTVLSSGLASSLIASPEIHFEHLEVQLALLRHGKDWNSRPRALIRLASEIRKRCNIPLQNIYTETGLEQIVDLPTPIIFFTGKEAFAPPSLEVAREIRWVLDAGGFLFFDDQEGRKDSPFYQSARKFMARVFPETPDPIALPDDHTVYQSYYLLKKPRGRLARADFLEGWQRGNVTPAIFSHNDLLGAFEADQSGIWRFNLEVGGGFSRELCFRLGINLLYYVLTINYKKDRAFPPVLKRRRRQ